MAQALANPDLISLAAGFVDTATLPIHPTQSAFQEIFADDVSARRALQYGSTLGDPELRADLLQRSLAPAGGTSDQRTIDQVLITSGSNQLLHLVSEVLFDPGDIVLCASPTYLVFLGTLANLGVRSVGVATDEQGLIPEAIEEQLRRFQSDGQLDRVKAIYAVPYFDNPRGVTMPAARTSAIIELVKRAPVRHRIFVIADEAYRELRYAGAEVPSALSLDDEGDTVILAGTFSKSYSPGIRLGWGVLPRNLVRPVSEVKGNIDFGSPNLNQVLMRQILRRGSFDRHVAHIRATYAEKLATMLAAADEHLAPLPTVKWTRPDGGLYLWVELAPEIDSGPSGVLLERAIEMGVLYVPGQYAYAQEGKPAARNTMRLSFGVCTTDQIRTGVAALAKAMRSL
jgi:2-aminoadipate transaminase